MGYRRTIGALLLLPGLLVAAYRPGGEDAARRMKSLEDRFTQELESWRSFRKQATSRAERDALKEAFPRDEFASELQALAQEAKGTPTAARAWYLVHRMGAMLDDRELYARGLEHLLDEHMDSRETSSLALSLVYGAPRWSTPLAEDALRRILAATTSSEVRASALVELSLLVGLDDTLGEAGRAEAETLLQRIEKDYPDSEFLGMTGAQFAAGARHEIDALKIGKACPDFEVTDQDGVRFKLSDYRGRVVLLDFWGFV